MKCILIDKQRKVGSWAWSNEANKGEDHLPEAFLGSRLPFQGDGIRNNICGGEFSHFEGRWQNRTLKANKQCSLRAELGALIYQNNKEQLRNLWHTCRAHPRATASSAFSVVLSSFPKNLLILSLTAGILEAPPTISTAYMSSFFSSNGT